MKKVARKFQPCSRYQCLSVNLNRSLHTGQPYSDQELITRVKRGDRDAQYLLYKKYVDAMYHTVLRMVNSQADTQDIVQECFIKVFEKIKTYRSEATLGAWIKRIAINTAINALRKQKRSLEFASDQVPDYPSDDEWEPQVVADPERVHEAIKSLPAGCRNVLNLYVFEGYSHKEVAEILQVTESTSKTQYRRAKSLLRSSLGYNMIENET